MKKLSWTPKRCGHVYCAPACGHGCTHTEYLRAHRQAGKALTKIRQKHPKLAAGLKVHVHENLGWHWELKGKYFNFHSSALGDGRLYILASPGGHGGRPEWMLDDTSKSAYELLKRTVEKAKAEVAELQAAIDGMEALL